MLQSSIMDQEIIATIGRKFQRISSALNERTRRLWVATEAMELGHGGITAVSAATGIARDTITRGIKELQETSLNDKEPVNNKRIRATGGGRKKLTAIHPHLTETLESLVDPVTRGDPESPLRWTCKSTTKLAAELTNRQFSVSPRTVANLLLQLGYRLQANRKTLEGKQNPDRNLQFEHINKAVHTFQDMFQPTISIDTKKKELIGNYARNGQEWNPKKHPEEVLDHDFPDKQLGKVVPYGVYDMIHNEGWVSVGIDHDTAQFATASILRWWTKMGQFRFPHAKKLLISADGGGSNGHRNRLWKVCLQELATTIGLELSVCHFPPGTSKWNKIEHRMFSYITQNWRGRPLLTRQSVVELIGNTRTQGGLIIQSELDENVYETGIKVSDEKLKNINITPDDFHGEWNYVIKPK